MRDKKSRGRPKGTGIATDRKVLDCVADLILSEPSLPPTTAIKRMVPNWTDTIVHRLLAKWRKEKDALLAAAKERESRNQAERALARATQVGRTAGDQMTRAIRMINSPSAAYFGGMLSPNFANIVLASQVSPAARIMDMIERSPTFRLIQEVQKNPVLKAIEDHERIKRIFGL